MTWQLIPTDSTPFYSQITSLDGVPYLLTFSYSQRANVWYLAIATKEGAPLLYGVQLVCGWNLLRKLSDPRKPPGVLMVMTSTSDSSPPGLNDLSPGGRCALIYVPLASTTFTGAAVASAVAQGTVVVQGPLGPQGPPGPAGPAGLVGPVGAIGPTGAATTKTFAYTAPPLASAFTIINAGGAALSTLGSNLVFKKPSSGSTANSRSLAVLTPPAPPYTLTVGLDYQLFFAGTTLQGIVLADGSGKFIEFGIYSNGTSVGVILDKFTNPTTAGTAYQNMLNGVILKDTIFLHARDDNTNLTWKFSQDGVYANGIQIDQRSRTDWLTAGPTQLGLVLDANNTDTRGSVCQNVFHWLTPTG